MDGYKFIEKEGYFKLKTKKSLVIISFLIASVLGTHAAIPLLLPGPEVVAIAIEKPKVVDTSKVLVSWIQSQNKGVSETLAKSIVNSSTYWASMYGLDPLLVLSLIKVESRFNVFAVSNSNALGLMQYIPRWHKEKITENTNPFDIHSNIHTGTKILREYIDKHGTIEKALLQYNGALNNPNNYATAVLTTRKELNRYIDNQPI